MNTQQILDLIIAAIILSAIWAQLGTFISHKIRIVSIQSILLSSYIILLGIWNSQIELAILGILIVLLRGILMSRILSSKISRSPFILRERLGDASWISIISILILIFSFVTYRILFTPLGYETIGDGGFALLFQGIFLIGSRKSKFSQFLGYVEEENAIIMLSLGIISLPLIIEVSVLLDVLALLIVSTVLMSDKVESQVYEEMMG
ncbi:MAG: hypothetical protein ACYDAO_07890 [Thermoplasmataceae archaeon]